MSGIVLYCIAEILKFETWKAFVKFGMFQILVESRKLNIEINNNNLCPE